ncbi:queuine tRNA-ribosyltransferase accessory subunit 2-like [Sycon ciliatum]|uniref:queuine tRNA-ribosyltransferase accessory subunit 2-like n=1 Tax=Sycon ciliatum TaxID=27933 RepID=UPI0031F69F84
MSMNFIVENLGAEGARLGRWICSNGVSALHTPGCMLYTGSGSVPNLGTELLAAFPSLPAVCQISVASTYGRPSTATLQALKKSLLEFYKLSKTSSSSYVSVQEATQCVDHSFNENKTVSIWTECERIKLSPDAYMSFQQAARPDAFESLCDTVASSSTAASKRCSRSVDRTLQHLDRCLELRATMPELQHSAVFGVVEGGSFVEHRVRSAKETAKRPVAGFAFEGLEVKPDTLESVMTTVQAAVAELPADKPRIFHGPASPEDIVRLVECGIDIFDSSYPYLLAENGIALNLDLALESCDSDVDEGCMAACPCPAAPSAAAAASNSGADSSSAATASDSTSAGAAVQSPSSVAETSATSDSTVAESRLAEATTATPHAPSSVPGETTATGEERPNIAGAVAHPDFSKRRTPSVALGRDVHSFELDLTLDRYLDDFGKLSVNCQCPACSQGCTRAYAYHLLKNGELLADIHLMQHNLYSYITFFQALRNSAQITDAGKRANAWHRLKQCTRNSTAAA